MIGLHTGVLWYEKGSLPCCLDGHKKLFLTVFVQTLYLCCLVSLGFCARPDIILDFC